MKVFCYMDESKPRTVVLECKSFEVYEMTWLDRFVEGELYHPFVIYYYAGDSSGAQAIDNVLTFEVM